MLEMFISRITVWLLIALVIAVIIYLIARSIKACLMCIVVVIAISFLCSILNIDIMDLFSSVFWSNIWEKICDFFKSIVPNGFTNIA